MAKGKAIAAGHICLDITPAIHSKTKKDADRFFAPGRLIAVDEATISLGGSVANTGIGMKRLGADVELGGMTGNDEFGRMLRSELAGYGISDSTMKQSDEVSTSYSVILAPPGIDRIILHHPGANDLFTEDDVDYDLVARKNLFHFGYPPHMHGIYKDNARGLKKILKRVHELGVATSVDMVLFEEDSEVGALDWDAILLDCMPDLDFFVPSVEELCLMLDRERYHEWLRRAEGRDLTTVLDPFTDVKPLADRLLSYGAKVLLIKCGAPGIYFRTAGREKLLTIGGGIGERIADSWADVEYFEESYHVEKVLSGTGAGDTTIAGFLTALLEECPWQDCLHLAAAAGASCVQTYDSLSGIPTLDELKEKIRAGWPKDHRTVKEEK
ncbi:MAG: carbohydrate kinase family protein [Blautia sp.]|nr:carbohydrate kinase family protein [Blautia sp.]